MRFDRGRTAWAQWALWLTAFVAATLIMRGTRESMDQTTATSVYILIVLGATAGGARWVGFLMAVSGFIAINYFFQPPFDTLTVDKPIDVLALVAFLATALVTNHLLSRAKNAADNAVMYAAEVQQLSVEARRADQLRETTRLRDVLLASVSHDLRTPLTAIRARAQDIAGDASVAPAHERASAIVAQVDRLTQMVADVLDLSRLRAGGFTMHPEVNTAEDLIGAAVRQFSASHSNRIETVIDYGKPALVGVFDFVQSLRVLTNLIENALRYSPSSAIVTIGVTASAGWLVITVADRGPGVSTEERDHIFEPFYRPKGPPTDAGTAGLGLSIARQIAEAQGGAVTYADRPGGGSVFTFELPAGGPASKALA